MKFLLLVSILLPAFLANAEMTSRKSDRVKQLGGWQTGLSTQLKPGKNRILIFNMIYDLEKVQGEVASKVEYGGVPLKRMAQSVIEENWKTSQEIWYLLEEDLQSVNSSLFKITWPDNTTKHLLSSSALFGNVDQDNPFLHLESLSRIGDDLDLEFYREKKTISIFCGGHGAGGSLSFSVTLLPVIRTGNSQISGICGTLKTGSIGYFTEQVRSDSSQRMVGSALTLDNN